MVYIAHWYIDERAFVLQSRSCNMIIYLYQNSWSKSANNIIDSFNNIRDLLIKHSKYIKKQSKWKKKENIEENPPLSHT